MFIFMFAAFWQNKVEYKVPVTILKVKIRTIFIVFYVLYAWQILKLKI